MSTAESHAIRTQLTDTQTISIKAPRGVVFDFVADPRNLPRWAPDFAREVRAEDDVWIVETDAGEELTIRVRASREHGTVDFLAAAAPEGVELGAFSRVVSNGEGSEFMFTRFFADEISPAEVERERGVVREELLSVLAACERPTAGRQLR